MFSVAGPPIGWLFLFLILLVFAPDPRIGMRMLFFLGLIYSYVFGFVSALLTGVAWANLRNLRSRALALGLLVTVAASAQAGFAFYGTGGRAFTLGSYGMPFDIAIAVCSALICVALAEWRPWRRQLPF